MTGQGRVLEKNALAVRHAKAADGKRTTYRIKGERGLELRVQPSGAATWAFTYAKGPRDERAVKRIVIGHRDDTDLTEACAKAAKLRAAILDGDPFEEAKARKAENAKGVFTFEQLSQSWLERHAIPNKGERSVKNDRGMLLKHILPVIGQMEAQQVAKRDILDIVDADTLNGLKVHANRVLGCVRSIFRWGISEDLITNDPTQGVKPRTKEVSRDRVLSADEVRAFWLALDKALSKDLATAIRLALVTGQRIGEVSCISKSELVLTPGKAVWTLPARRSKNQETHRVPLSPMAVALIDDAMKVAGHSTFLFPSKNGEAPIHPHAASRAMVRVRSGIGVENVRIHDMRRTAASQMAQLGVSPHTISLVLNHISAAKSTITGAVYIKYGFDREKRQALDLWAEHLERILAGTENDVATNVLPLVRA